ncbi:radical SAM protein [Desulfolutivibrio sulfoxidireducens]|uniref:radical SAM protein n=1 Tax=Desulfolutivibrio sulfoxidireducens TaxID=2773299 RepID=UPI00159E48A4|nr:radical SAM protein [Desulfolutivibrio sulfoxidireducens]QLA14723.1 radical SAM protein [Desulfolutivibrio sulfoxidireducens]QLA18304.1 radical SAM protein [Desulfolutivibrio sulfoxidireducens]
MRLTGSVIRPPSEADSILLQVTLGCSHNKCAFCGAYIDKPFRVVPEAAVDEALAFARDYGHQSRRVFLCDGDAMVLSTNRLTRLLTRIRERLPFVSRISAYANARSLGPKSVEELAALRGLGLHTLYMGLETGDQETLSAMNKADTVADIVAAGQKVRRAGLRLSVTVLLGLAGTRRWRIHAERTGAALSEMDPAQAAALTLMLVPGTPLHADWKAGRFDLPHARGMLSELSTMLAHTHLSRGLFLANHASNFLPLALRLPRDKDHALSLIEAALSGRIPLRPDHVRAL